MTDEIKLPEPAVRYGEYAGPPGEGASEDLFTADQVRAAVLAERERAASVCDREVQYLCEVGEDRAAVAVGVCAAAIRSGK